MLRKFAYNKIFRTTGMLLLLLLLLVFPASKKYELDDQIVKASVNLKNREIYLLDKYGYVARTLIPCSKTGTKLAEKLIEMSIIDGKYQDDIPMGFRAFLPVDLKINDIKIKDDNIYIDFSKEFFDIKKNDLIKTIELITYNLTSIEGINNVYILVDSKEVEEFNGVYLSQPFSRKDGINKNYDYTSYKGVNSITVYYVNNSLNKPYYVPVTKLTNDKREKVEIIIEELTNSNVFTPELMSYLNYNTRLINYKVDDNIINLNFNDNIFDSVKNNILSDVVNTISLSIRDNYDVNEVSFLVNDEKITKSVLKDIE